MRVPLPSAPVAPPPEPIVSEFTAPTTVYPAFAQEIADVVASLRLPSASDPGGRLRTLFGFVTDEVALAPTGSDDALLTLAAREGSAVTLHQSGGQALDLRVPSRHAKPLRLSAIRSAERRGGRSPRPR